jgi:sortase A
LALDGDRRHSRAASDAGPAGPVAAAALNGTARDTLNGTGNAAADGRGTGALYGLAGAAPGEPAGDSDAPVPPGHSRSLPRFGDREAGAAAGPTGRGSAAAGGAGSAEDAEQVAAPAPAGGLTSREVTIERIRTGIRGLGQAFITFGVVVLLFVAYELWVTDLFNRHTQGQLADQLSDTWSHGEDPLSPTVDEPGVKVRDLPIGRGIALIRIPALGLDYVRVVVEGTAEASLAEGPGHYVGTALPGQIGNFAIAGHRVGKGSPFLDLDRLRTGDAIVIETKTTYYVYRVLGDRRTGNPAIPDGRGIPGREIVAPSDTGVIRPVPGHPGLAPFARFLTLTTCHPRFSARQRLVIHAELAGPPLPKSNGLPPVLRR